MRRTTASILAIAAMAISPAAMANSGSAQTAAPTAKEWYPKSLDLTALRQHEAQSNPYGADYDYAKEGFWPDLG